MSIQGYLKDFTTVREELFNHKLFYDLKMAAARREYHLKIFQSNVDIEGFDIMLDDNQKACRFQLKTRFNSQTRVLKNIHSVMLLPKRRNANLIRFDNGICPTLDNGVIFIDIKYLENDICPKVDYYYLDFYLLHSISEEFISSKLKYKCKAQAILEELLCSKRKNKRIKVPISLFIKLKDASSLLAICGFDSEENNTLQYFYMKIFAKEYEKYETFSNENSVIYKNSYTKIINELTYNK
ncbi:MAG: hypothetical protein RBR97_19865 [Bacteroidales bacterium]|nr:hypothetical protein [Bacteroidales bacterium]